MKRLRQKLIEVALPLKAINESAAREKSIRHGHPAMLHLWWARRPLAACRAVLFASLVDDPDSDPAYRRPDGSVDEDRAGMKRAQLFNLIEELVQWENSNNTRVINLARAEIARCVASRKIETGELIKDTIVYDPNPNRKRLGQKHPKGALSGEGLTAWEILLMKAAPDAVNAFLADHAPPVLDPFCGGGSIPLEAQRLGLRAYASDLNPVAVLITKALIEIPPKFAGWSPVNSGARGSVANSSARARGGKLKAAPDHAAAMRVWDRAQGLAEDIRYYSEWMRSEAEKRIGHLYPKVKITAKMAQGRPDLKEYVGEELTVIAWLWARTIECPNPSCRQRTPLVRSFWLSKKKGKEVFAKPVLTGESQNVRFEIRMDGQPPKHTTDRTGARCLYCDTFIKKPQLRDIATSRGVMEIPLAIVAGGKHGRVYVSGDSLPLPSLKRPIVPFLEQPMTNDRRWFSPPLYGMPNFADLFTARQLLALTTFSDLVLEARERVRQDAIAANVPDDQVFLAEGGCGATAYADAVATYLGLGISRSTNTHCTIAIWSTTRDQSINAFGRQAIPMAWDFPEVNPFAGAAGDLRQTFESMTNILSELPACQFADVRQIDATAAIDCPSKPVISTDPPYYDNIGYAGLSDFFYVWLRRSLSTVYPALFATLLTPKTQELIATAIRHDGSKAKAQAFFEEGLGKAFSRMQESLIHDIPMTLFYAFKQAETDDDVESDDLDAFPSFSTGWETMLMGLIRAGFCILGTWPMRTERDQGLKTGTNVLASSIILVCRPRPADATLATRKQFITALRQELPEALRNLQHGNIAPVDLAQAAIGPGMAVFTRYAKVMETDGSAMSVRTALGLINQSLDEVLAEQEGEFDGETRWALAWFEQFGMDEGPFGVAETLSKAKNTAINGLVESGIVTARAGKVRLVKRAELADDWKPGADAHRLAIWLVTQLLIRALDQHGESGAAALLHHLGGIAEIARDLAYRLYTICERKKWADEALAYNGLVIAWPELTKLSLAQRTEPKHTQPTLDYQS